MALKRLQNHSISKNVFASASLFRKKTSQKEGISDKELNLGKTRVTEAKIENVFAEAKTSIKKITENPGFLANDFKHH